MNKQYQKGRRKEYKIVNEAKERGCIAFRSAGSHSPIDVVIIDNPAHRITLIQSKAGLSFKPWARKRLMEENLYLNGVYEVEFIIDDDN